MSWERLKRWDRRWWWLVVVAITVENVVFGAPGVVIAALAFVAGLNFARRFPRGAKRTVGKRRSVQL